jgi:hypothetical protein
MPDGVPGVDKRQVIRQVSGHARCRVIVPHTEQVCSVYLTPSWTTGSAT